MTKTIFDRGILIPIGIGTFSVLGICLILLIGYVNKPKADVPVEQTTTPFKYLFFGTETFAVTPELETSTPEERFKGLPTASETPTTIITLSQEQITPTSVSVPTQTNMLTSNNSIGSTPTATFDETTVLTAGKYDDTAPLLNYDGDWSSELFIDNAYQGTLYISLEIADSMKFNFVGKQFIIGYIGDTDFGIVEITVDNAKYMLDQSSGSEWISPQLTQGVHSVIILHKTGDLANLDYINILE